MTAVLTFEVRVVPIVNVCEIGNIKFGKFEEDFRLEDIENIATFLREQKTIKNIIIDVCDGNCGLVDASHSYCCAIKKIFEIALDYSVTLRRFDKLSEMCASRILDVRPSNLTMLRSPLCFKIFLDETLHERNRFTILFLKHIVSTGYVKSLCFDGESTFCFDQQFTLDLRDALSSEKNIVTGLKFNTSNGNNANLLLKNISAATNLRLVSFHLVYYNGEINFLHRFLARLINSKIYLHNFVLRGVKLDQEAFDKLAEYISSEKSQLKMIDISDTHGGAPVSYKKICNALKNSVTIENMSLQSMVTHKKHAERWYQCVTDNRNAKIINFADNDTFGNDNLYEKLIVSNTTVRTLHLGVITSSHKQMLLNALRKNKTLHRCTFDCEGYDKKLGLPTPEDSDKELTIDCSNIRINEHWLFTELDESKCLM